MSLYNERAAAMPQASPETIFLLDAGLIATEMAPQSRKRKRG